MNLLTKLIKLRDEAKNKKLNEEYNFNLQEHEIGNQKIYRLHYINYSRGGYYHPEAVYLDDWYCKPFMLPDGMNREDAFKVISYLNDSIDKICVPFSIDEVNTLTSVLTSNYGFKETNEPNIDNIIELFFVGGRLKLFENHPLYNKYFEWYVNNVSKEEVIDIYSKLGVEFNDIDLEHTTTWCQTLKINK